MKGSRERIARARTRGASTSTKSAQAPAWDHESESAGAVHSYGRVQLTPAGRRVQMRPRIGDPKDHHEVEADRVATSVTGRPDPFPKVGGARDAQTPPEAADAVGALGGGSPLPDGVRERFEPRLGRDLSGVRIHTDDAAATAAVSMQARAFTYGEDIAFAPGSYRPESGEGEWLLAHELAHVGQQGGGREGRDVVQRGFFDDLWSGIQSVGRAIGSAFEWIGNAVSTAFDWIAGRVEDAGRWIANLLRDLPGRLLRFGEAIVGALGGLVSFIPDAIGALISGGISGFGDWLWERARAGAVWVHRIVTSVFDLVGGGELVEFIMHMMSKATPLTTEEIDAGKMVLGNDAIHWGDVRVAEGGFLALVFALNGGRAFTTFHTINIPETGDHGRSNRAIMVHELTHVYQYERVGSRYLGEAIHAQATIGYGYGGAAGLAADRAAGRHFSDYNREQQAQIAQDYYELVTAGTSTTDYDPFIAELQAGQI